LLAGTKIISTPHNPSSTPAHCCGGYLKRGAIGPVKKGVNTGCRCRVLFTFTVYTGNHIPASAKTNAFRLPISKAMHLDLQQTVILVTVGLLLSALVLGITLFRTYRYEKADRLKRQRYDDTEQEKKLLHARLEVREQTFNIISEEIHDNVGQMLSLAKIQLSMIESRFGTGDTHIEELKKTLNTVTADLREIASGLNGNTIKTFNLPEIVHNLAARINECNTTRIIVNTQGKERKITDKAKFVCFRVIQEIIQNCLKHAKASSVWVQLMYMDDFLHVSIEDNGIGFAVDSSLRSGRGLGLQNIYNRISLVNGLANISSQPLKGTQVALRIPYAASFTLAE
jgi:two-component system, NarL family, sensor kinase